MLAHKADTEERHRRLSAASFAIWPQLHPRASIYLSMSLLVVLSSCFRLGPAQGYFGMDEGAIMLTCLIHLHLLFFTSSEMGSIPARSSRSALNRAYFVWPKNLRNSSESLVLEYFQHVAYSFGQFPRHCSILVESNCCMTPNKLQESVLWHDYVLLGP